MAKSKAGTNNLSLEQVARLLEQLFGHCVGGPADVEDVLEDGDLFSMAARREEAAGCTTRRGCVENRATTTACSSIGPHTCLEDLPSLLLPLTGDVSVDKGVNAAS